MKLRKHGSSKQKHSSKKNIGRQIITGKKLNHTYIVFVQFVSEPLIKPHVVDSYASEQQQMWSTELM